MVVIQAVRHKILGIIRDVLNEEIMYLIRYVRIEGSSGTYTLTFTHPCASLNNWDFVALRLAEYYNRLFYSVGINNDGLMFYKYTLTGYNVGKINPEKRVALKSVNPFVTSVTEGRIPFYAYLRREGNTVSVYPLLNLIQDSMSENYARAVELLKRCLGWVGR